MRPGSSESGRISPAGAVTLTATQGMAGMLVGLHPEPGNYEIHLPPGVERQPGERWDFFCPVCQESLASRADDNLCVLDLRGDDKVLRRVLFSRIAGEHATFVLADEGAPEAHGEHAGHYEAADVQMKYLL